MASGEEERQVRVTLSWMRSLSLKGKLVDSGKDDQLMEPKIVTNLMKELVWTKANRKTFNVVMKIDHAA